MNRIARIVALSLLPGVGVLAVPDAPAQPAFPPGTSQPQVALIPPATFGTTSESVRTVFFSEFEGENPSVSWLSVCVATPAGGCLKAPGGVSFGALTVPTGALITRIELDGCDLDAANELEFGLIIGTGRVGSGAVIAASGATGVAVTPGCALFNAPLATPTTIDNGGNVYTLFVKPSPSASLSIAFTAIRVYYRLQVSPAPATATFGDVPVSHPFFQFVEALVASGITVGCGGGLYCVDNPITRGEMAVFLSKALGLHFAP